MGPGFESRERAAPASRGGAGARGASMGPGFESRERVQRLGAVGRREVALQWGPASRAGRGMRCARKGWPVFPLASMGPGFESRERGYDRRGDPLRGHGASMGPGFESRERGWCRRCSGPQGPRRFNGARLREPGEGEVAIHGLAGETWLQWGPASRAGRGRHHLPAGRAGGPHASMGPGFESRERVSRCELHETDETKASMGPGFESRERAHPPTIPLTPPFQRLNASGTCQRAPSDSTTPRSPTPSPNDHPRPITIASDPGGSRGAEPLAPARGV